jgi:hypothetical protein
VGETVVIDARFKGPPDSGNGGYTCGCVARALGAGPAEVSLRVPPPLETELALAVDGEGARLLDGETVVADGRPASSALGDVPEPVGPEDARAAASHSTYLDDTHPFPTCFVCGPKRGEGDGLRIFPGRVAGRDGLFAAPWTPDLGFAREDRSVAPEIVWAALDCPTSAPLMNEPGPDGKVLPIVLARLGAELHEPAVAGAEHVLTSWEIGRDGRKREAGAALFDAGGRLLARARALWIELRPAAAS